MLLISNLCLKSKKKCRRDGADAVPNPQTCPSRSSWKGPFMFSNTKGLFQVPVAKFQELRYNVALILKEMNDLEKRSVLKIQD